MKELGGLLVVVGMVVVLVGLLMLVAGKIPWLGHLPGDLHLRGRNWSFSFPLATCLLASVVLTVLLNLVLRLFRR